MDDRACKAEQLALPGGEVIATLAHDFIQTVIQTVDEFICIHIPAGSHDFLITDAFLTQQDIAADIAAEEEYILQHLPEMLAQTADLDLLDIDAVNQDLAFLNIIVAADQGKDRGLA